MDEKRRNELKLLGAGAVAVPVAYVGVKHGAIASALGMKQSASPVNSQYYPFPPLNADPQGAPPGAMWYNAPLGVHRYANGVTGKAQNVQTPTLGSLEDVSLFAPADGQYFGFDMPSSKWMNKTLPAPAWSAILNPPYVTVSPIGLKTPGVTAPNNNANFGPDTPGTSTRGLQEAMDSIKTTGGTLGLMPGLFVIDTTLTWDFPIYQSGSQSFLPPLILMGLGGPFQQNTDAVVGNPPSGTTIAPSDSFPSGSPLIQIGSSSASPYPIAKGIVFRNVTFSGVASSSAGSITPLSAGVVGWNMESALFDNCNFLFTNGDGLHSDGVYGGNNTFLNCTAFGCTGWGFRMLEGNGESVMNGSFAYNCGSGGTSTGGFQLGKNTTAQGCWAQGTNGADFFLYGAVLIGCGDSGPVPETLCNVATANGVANVVSGCMFKTPTAAGGAVFMSLSGGDRIAVSGGAYTLDGTLPNFFLNVNGFSGVVLNLTGGVLVAGSYTITTFINHNGSTTDKVSVVNLSGYNPQGFAVTTPAFPAAATNVQNTNPYPVRIYLLTAGTGTSFTITDPSGTAQVITVTLAAGMEFTLDPGAQIQFGYTIAPTWKWYGI